MVGSCMAFETMDTLFNSELNTKDEYKNTVYASLHMPLSTSSELLFKKSVRQQNCSKVKNKKQRPDFKLNRTLFQ